MNDMFEQHFNREELPHEIATLIELTEVLNNHVKNLRAMQVTATPISLSLSSELSELVSETSTVIDLFTNVTDARLQEYYNAYKNK